jgi:hypothetical protein
VTFECSFDGDTYVPCTSPYSITGISDNGFTFWVRATDAAGNVDASPAFYPDIG